MTDWKIFYKAGRHMKEKQKIILKVIFLSLVPVILNYMAKSDSCLDYFQKTGIIGQNVRLQNT